MRLMGDNPAVTNTHPRWTIRLAGVLALVSVVATLASLFVYVDNRRHLDVSYTYADVVAGVLYPCLGAFLVRRRPDNRVGWVLVATWVVGLNGLANQYAVSAVLVHPGLPLAALAAWFASWAWVPELAVPVFLPVLFPDGRLPSRRWRPFVVAAGVLLATAVLVLAFSRHPIDANEGIFNPVQVGGDQLFLVGVLAVLGLFVLTPVGLVSLVLRTRRAHGVERAQLQWLQFSVLVAVILLFLPKLLPPAFGEAVFTLAVAAIPVGIAVAVLRHQLLDIQLVLNRTITYAVLTGVVVVAYLAVVELLGDVAAERLGVVAVAVLALLLAGVRERVQRTVDRALFGSRRDPYAVVDRLGRRVDAASGPLDALEQLTVELRAALRLPSVAVVPDADSLEPIRSGREVAGALEVPIAVHGRRIGVLRVGHRHAGERLRLEEQSVLNDAARRAGALLQAAALVTDLQQSRERIVAAREEERRRLRHDLHDGVGPQLAGLALQLESLERRLRDDPELTSRVQRLRDRLRETVGEVRRVVDDLRPPALDDVGLVGAVREHTAAFATGGALLVEVVAPQPLPALPAAVEVAAYRIVTEAVTNAVRHADPRVVAVTMSVEDGDLVLRVRDDGTGVQPDAVPGVGLTSMEERAAEVGGTLLIDSGADGTTVTARLPMPGASAPDTPVRGDPERTPAP
jgi:signal transduction histidine kinase